MTMSRAGLEFLAELEGGMHLQPYADGYGYDTIGVGHVIMDHEPHLRGGITREQGLSILADDVQEACEAVVRYAPQTRAPHEFDALACFVFNIGVGAFRRSTLVRRLAAGEDRRVVVSEELPRWNRAGGRVSDGLIKRRRETAELFRTGDYVRDWHDIHQQET